MQTRRRAPTAGGDRPVAGWSTAERVLAVRLDAMGDVLMTTPAIRAVKRSHPDRAVTLLASSAGAVVAPLVPEIDDVIVYDAPWVKATPLRSAPDLDLATIDRLRRRRFDAAIVFTVYSQSALPAALLCTLAGVPLRLAHSRERAYQLLTDALPEPEPERLVRHEVRRQLDLVASVGYRTDDDRLSLCVEPGRVDAVRAALEARGVDLAHPWAVIHPGASAPSRRYPPASFAEVATRLVRDHGRQVVFVSGPREGALVAAIRGAVAAPTASLGALDVGGLAALLSLAPVLIANNSGPVHVAAAVGTPVVDVYALTNPQHTPWGVRSRVLFRDVPCRNCYASVCPLGHHDCLRLVAPGSVVAAAIDVAAPPSRGAASRRRAERPRTSHVTPAGAGRP